MSRITVIGAGPLGRAATASLTEQGADITVATRSGTALPGAQSVSADITAAAAVDALPTADAIIACCNFPYGAWQQNWPLAIEHLIAAAEQRQATLVIAGNLYAYGPSTGPFKETDPFRAEYRNGRVRAQVWRSALAAHDDGRIRATEIRGSDYIGPRTGGNTHGGDRLLRPAITGKTARILGDPDQPHSWTAVSDFGSLLARAATDASMWGRAWHVPTAAPVSIRELATLATRIAGVATAPKLQRLPRWLIHLLALASPAVAGLRDAAYQFDAPFVIDDTDARELLSLTATPLETTIEAAVRALQQEDRPAA